MTPHLSTFIDAIESAAGKRNSLDLTAVEKIAMCVSAGVSLDFASAPSSQAEGSHWCQLITKRPVGFAHDGGGWRVFELKE